MRSGCFNLQFCVHKLSHVVLMLLAVSPTLAGYSWSAPARSRPWKPEQESAGSAPVFEIAATLQGFTVLVGQTVVLPCVVHNLGDKVVSWIRTRDLHILTSDIHVFTSDSRVEVVHLTNSDFWGLKIKTTQLSDSGKYECQVNTDPKMNYAVMLTVTDSHMHDSPMDEDSGVRERVIPGSSSAAANTARIEGPREQVVRVGSTITFTCVVSRAAHAATSSAHALLKWTRAGRDVTFQSSRGGISVDTDYREERITSRLTIAMVTADDAGKYTCHDVDAAPDTVTLLVVEGERTEAMQRDPPNGALLIQNSFLLYFFVYFNWILR